MATKADIVTFPRSHKQELLYRCSVCGADRGCDCNAPAIEKAITALAAIPRKSDRAIAAEQGINPRTVAKARKQLLYSAAVDQRRIGLDSRMRRMPQRIPDDDADNPPADVMAPIDPMAHKLQRKIFKFTAAYNSAVRDWLKRANVDQHTREVLSRSIHQCANDLSILAQGVMSDD
jgi:hypothetical protein